jgi:RNA recognition motif-containing protein
MTTWNPPIEASKQSDHEVLPEYLRTLFLGNLSFQCSEQDIYEVFCCFGEIISIRLMKDLRSPPTYFQRAHQREPVLTQRCLGYGFLTFASYQSILAAKSMNGRMLLDREMR